MHVSDKQLKNMTASDWERLAEFHKESADSYDDPSLTVYKLRSEKLARAFYALAEVYADVEREG